MSHAKLGLICLATAARFAAAAGNQLLDPELVMVPAPLPNEPPIRAKTEENQKSRLWREDHIVYPEWVVRGLATPALRRGGDTGVGGQIILGGYVRKLAHVRG